jgi:hypothetical protein
MSSRYCTSKPPFRDGRKRSTREDHCSRPCTWGAGHRRTPPSSHTVDRQDRRGNIRQEGLMSGQHLPWEAKRRCPTSTRTGHLRVR